MLRREKSNNYLNSNAPDTHGKVHNFKIQQTYVTVHVRKKLEHIYDI
jgi:hypothetical protein